MNKNTLKKLLFILISIVLGLLFHRFITIDFIDYFNPCFSFVEYITLLILQIVIWYEIIKFFFDKWTTKDKMIIFICYFIVMLIVLLDRPVRNYMDNIIINPFNSLSEVFYSLRNIVIATFNIVLFIPLVVLGTLLNSNIKKNMIYASILGLLIEVIQVILHRGIFDTADIILYMIGIIISKYVYNFLFKKSKN